MRTLLLELRPQELVEIELHELLEQLIAAMECRKKMDVTVDARAGRPRRRDDGSPFYRIAQEALTNITRHSAASVVSITLTRASRATAISPSGVELRIVDNGRGFDVEQRAARAPRAVDHAGAGRGDRRRAAHPLGAGSRHRAAAAGRRDQR